GRGGLGDEVGRAGREWVLAGTETTSDRRTVLAQRPRIKAPVTGTRIALDPDMPPEHQRLLLEAESVDERWRWRLDGGDLGAARESRLWEPTPGRHVLELIDAEGAVRDGVSFEVRGTARR